MGWFPSVNQTAWPRVRGAVEDLFEDSLVGPRRMLLLLYLLVLPPFAGVLWELSEPRYQAIATAAVVGICLAGAGGLALSRTPTKNTWVFPLGVAPVVSCAVAYWATDMPAFMGVIGAPLAWAAALSTARTVLVAMLVGDVGCLAVSVTRHGLAAGVGNLAVFGLIQALVAWVAYGKSRRHREARLHMLARQVPDIELVIRSEDGRLVHANHRAVAAYGYTVPELLNLRIQDLRRADPQAVQTQMDRVTDSEPLVFESIHFRKDGSSFPVEVSSQRFDLDGEPHHHSLIRDITERRQRTVEREHLQAQLLQAQKMESIGRLAGGIAHDFNNMLSVILGRAEISTIQVPDGSPLREHLVEIEKAARRSADLTRQLLAFARQQPFNAQVLDLNAVISDALVMLRRLIGEQTTLTWHPAAGPVWVCADEAQLHQVLLNLCVNARDAVGEQGSIAIGVSLVDRRDRSYAALSVADDGDGIAPEAMPHLFDPFFTTKAQGKGTGLGLSTVYGIVSQHGGFTDVVSAPGQGATFIVHLPAVAQPEANREQDAPGSEPVEGRETILLVEDEPGVLDLGANVLDMLGYRVLRAALPSTALQIAEQHGADVDLVITDVVMPELTGPQLVERLTAINPHVRVLYMSGYPADHLEHGELTGSGAPLLRKPWSIAHLSAAVRQALS